MWRKVLECNCSKGANMLEKVQVQHNYPIIFLELCGCFFQVVLSFIRMFEN